METIQRIREMKIVDLKAILKANGIKGYSVINKRNIETFIGRNEPELLNINFNVQLPAKVMKPCKDNEERNEKTKRCRKKKVYGDCPDGKYRNPVTKRCKNLPGTKSKPRVRKPKPEMGIQTDAHVMVNVGSADKPVMVDASSQAKPVFINAGTEAKPHLVDVSSQIVPVMVSQSSQASGIEFKPIMSDSGSQTIDYRDLLKESRVSEKQLDNELKKVKSESKKRLVKNLKNREAGRESKELQIMGSEDFNAPNKPRSYASELKGFTFEKPAMMSSETGGVPLGFVERYLPSQQQAMASMATAFPPMSMIQEGLRESKNQELFALQQRMSGNKKTQLVASLKRKQKAALKAAQAPEKKEKARDKARQRYQEKKKQKIEQNKKNEQNKKIEKFIESESEKPINKLQLSRSRLGMQAEDVYAQRLRTERKEKLDISRNRLGMISADISSKQLRNM